MPHFPSSATPYSLLLANLGVNTPLPSPPPELLQLTWIIQRLFFFFVFSSSCKITSRLLRKVEVWRAWADFSIVRFWIKIKEVSVLGLVLKVVVGVLYRRCFIEKKMVLYINRIFFLSGTVADFRVMFFGFRHKKKLWLLLLLLVLWPIWFRKKYDYCYYC